MAARAHFNLNSSLRMRSLKQWGQTTSSEANNVSNAVVWLTKLQSPAERTLMKEVLYGMIELGAVFLPHNAR